MLSNDYYTSLERLKNTINRMPDDGQVRLEIIKDRGGIKRSCLVPVESFTIKGKVLVITTTVDV